MTTTAFFSPIATRFAWKEYRTLRGLWLAVLALGILVQWASYALHFGPTAIDWATMFFSIALGAAALYAVGVAATTFSMEHEEDTYTYISCLPSRWLPIFAGKLLFAATSAGALAAALSITGWILCGFETPGGRDTPAALGIFGFAIIEALAWGTLFSLLLRQPLLAALLAIAAQSLSLTWATSTFAEGTLPSLSIGSYLAVLPVRVAIVVCVAAIDVLLARRWLTAGNRPTRTLTAPDDTTSTVSAVRPLAHVLARTRSISSNYFSIRVLSHLLWQTWRQSWRLMFAMPAIAAFLCFAMFLIANIGELLGRNQSDTVALIPFIVALATTALYASAVFYADQRGQSYRYLAEHAAWPRHVWLSRQFVWTLPIALAMMIAVAIVGLVMFILIAHQRDRAHWYSSDFALDKEFIVHGWNEAFGFARGTVFALWALILGFAVGQACSMFFRRALVAGFVAIVCVVPLTLWGVAIWMWELPSTTFVLPLVFGLYAATWLRIPDWIVDRNQLWSWVKVAVALAVPIGFIAWSLPAARTISAHASREAIWQIGDSLGDRGLIRFDPYILLSATSVADNWVGRYEAEITRTERATADRLIRLAEMINSPTLPPRTEVEPDRTEADWAEYRTQTVNLNRAIVDEATRLSRETYRFPIVSFSDAGSKNTILDRLSNLIDLLEYAGQVAEKDGQLDAAMEHNLAALALWESIWKGRPSSVSSSPWSRQQLLQRMIAWANAEGQSSARIKQAIVELDSIYPSEDAIQPSARTFANLYEWQPASTLMADYLWLRAVIDGNETPASLNQWAGVSEYLAFLSSRLSFERDRARQVLNFLLINETAQWRDAVWRLNQRVLQKWARETILKRGDGGIADMGHGLRWRIQRAFDLSIGRRGNLLLNDRYPPYSWLRTTNLLRMELAQLEPFGWTLQYFADKQVSAWGLRQQLALIAYRVDHGDYPAELTALAPDYLPFVPIDPYSGRPFEYRPQGLPLEFRGNGNYPGRLPAGTPFLWSVGSRNAKLALRIVYDAVDPNAEPSDESAEIRHEVYMLEEPPTDWDYTADLVFPLPKSPPAE